MASTTYPDGTPASVNDLQFEILGAQWAGDGLIGAPGDTSAVFADSTGRQVKFRSGKHAHVHGHGWSSGAGDIIWPVAANGTSYPRIDLAVLGLDRSATPWRVTEYVKQGTPSASPVAPSLVRDAIGTGTGKWEIPLAAIAVGAGVVTINPADVTPLPVYVGQQKISVSDLATLAQIPAPVSGTTALVNTAAGPVDYLYASSTGWRRADWNTAWGLIGGTEYTGDGGVLAAGVGGSEAYLNLHSGPVATVAGRRYEVRARFRTWNTIQGSSQILLVRDTNISGNIRAMSVMSPMTQATSSFQLSYQPAFSGHWTAGDSASRDYLLTGYCAGPTGGLMYIARTLYGSELAGITLIDHGPATALGALA